MVITDEGEELWLGEGEITGLGVPALVTFCLPFTGGDAVLVGRYLLDQARGQPELFPP
jgi:hypothetical protein